MSSKSSNACLCVGGLAGAGFGAGDLVFCCLFIERIWAIQVVAGAS